MNCSELLESLLLTVGPFVNSEDRGRFELAEDPLHVVEMLSASPGGWGCILLDKGEQVENKGVQIFRSRFAFYIWQARGLSVNRGDKIPSLVARCEQVRDFVHTLRFPAADTAQVPQYEGREVVVMPDGFPLNAYELNFFLRISGTSPLPAQPPL
ncbi:MAG: hypothetical protein PF795_04625 [Kiritimatiellae bacterium]|jgi:hypothetical protein|nr:hypothetical protein [Kiritimatiellia bacterium]